MSDFKDDFEIYVYCETATCGNYLILDIDACIERFGDLTNWWPIADKMKCKKCGGRGGTFSLVFVGKGNMKNIVASHPVGNE